MILNPEFLSPTLDPTELQLRMAVQCSRVLSGVLKELDDEERKVRVPDQARAFKAALKQEGAQST